MKDKNGIEWIDGKHKESLLHGAKRKTTVVEAFGKEWLVRYVDGRINAWNEVDTAEFIEFVEPPETVEEIKNEIVGLLDETYPVATYCRKHSIEATGGNMPTLVMLHIVDRVVKAVEAEKEN